MAIEDVAPCRHSGAAPEAIVNKVSSIIESLASDASFLASKGLSAEEYALALPAAIERVRGRKSASNFVRRSFLLALFKEMVARGLASRVETPNYGEDTVYRLSVPRIGSIAVIQKGCPDGAHSSVRWARPAWATECYLWWLCSSTTYQPGEHVWKGLNRLRARFFSEAPGTVDGIIFHNELCGTSERPCPKSARSIQIEGAAVPPPCLYVMPERRDAVTEWNWGGDRVLAFPGVLQAMFGITKDELPSYIGHVGFQRRGADLRTTVSCHFGPGRSTTHRS